MAQISAAELRLAKSKVAENISDLVLLESCLQLDQSGKCRDQLTWLQNRSREFQQLMAGMVKEVPPLHQP